MKNKAPTLTDMREGLAETIRRLEADEITPKEANRVSAKAGATLRAARTALGLSRRR